MPAAEPAFLAPCRSVRAVRIEVHGADFLELRCNRIALMGYYQHALSPATKKLSIRELARPGPKAAAWIVNWE